jgi:hypothetical protein
LLAGNRNIDAICEQDVDYRPVRRDLVSNAAVGEFNLESTIAILYEVGS